MITMRLPSADKVWRRVKLPAQKRPLVAMLVMLLVFFCETQSAYAVGRSGEREFGDVSRSTEQSHAAIPPSWLAQSTSIKSKRSVINEVKRRYPSAKVLRVKLNQSQTAYSVRILLPDGKVKAVKVSAAK